MPQLDMYEQIKRGLGGIGYTGGLLRAEYEFADILSLAYTVRTVPLAAFAQEPPSYRNACFGVVRENGASRERLVAEIRSLGAPRVFEVGHDELRIWKMASVGEPTLLDSVRPNQVQQLFAERSEDWSPEAVLRGKAIPSEVSPSQRDFLDLGLLPLLDREVRIKLDRLLQEVLTLSLNTYRRQFDVKDEDYPALFRLVFRLIFRLIAAKVLADRGHDGEWDHDDPRRVVRAVETFYSAKEPALGDHDTQLAAWDLIRSAFHFQNLSVDALAYVYENTLVGPETRKLYGTHSTPPEIAQYIVDRLPWESLELQERRVFEPFAGHAVFLVAAMRKLRELLPATASSEQRHQYFVDMLGGVEIDDFAREVARLSLMLADYPNPDGWRLTGGDAFADGRITGELRAAQVVLCNPPFKDFSKEERRLYPQRRSVHKPAEILLRVLDRPPALLGFVLPRVFIDGRGYRLVRERLMASYSSIELLSMPDRTFRHSDAEAVLLIATGKPTDRVRLKTGSVREKEVATFYAATTPTFSAIREIDSRDDSYQKRLWVPPLSEVWDALGHCDRLGDHAQVHRGIEFSVSLRERLDELVSETPREGFSPGLYRSKGVLEPFTIRRSLYLNTMEKAMRGRAHEQPWGVPKVIVNRVRRSRGFWTISGAVDYQGLYCYQDFHGIWPTGRMSLEVLAAIVSGPVANAFAAVWEGKRDVRVRTILDIPVPVLAADQVLTLKRLVTEYRDARHKWMEGELDPARAETTCKELLGAVDGEVLRAYDLPPRLERMLLDSFRGQSRPGPVEFSEYFPASFRPFIPWCTYQSGELERATAAATLERLPVVDDPVITEALARLEAES